MRRIIITVLLSIGFTTPVHAETVCNGATITAAPGTKVIVILTGGEPPYIVNEGDSMSLTAERLGRFYNSQVYDLVTGEALGAASQQPADCVTTPDPEPEVVVVQTTQPEPPVLNFEPSEEFPGTEMMPPW